jgi:hypothetical protein
MKHTTVRQHARKTKWGATAVSRHLRRVKNCGLIPQPADSRFPKAVLLKGMHVELEHTTDKRLAKEIAKAHLMEDAEYYQKLELMEEGGKLLDKLEAGVLEPEHLTDKERLAVQQEQDRRTLERSQKIRAKTQIGRAHV